ncbi:MAG TPA: hypothetical protein VGN81_08780 [Pseudonocardiaceae bacterium]|jgi:hypothetical protein
MSNDMPPPAFTTHPTPPGAYPPPSPPQRNRRAAILCVVAVVVLGAAILVTSFVWPGWGTSSGSGPFAGGSGATTTGKNPSTGGHTGSDSDACSLVTTSQVQQISGTTSQVVARQQPTINDPVTGTPAHICAYTGNGITLAAVEVADYPTSVDPEQLVEGVGTTGTDAQPVPGIGDAAETITNLGHTSNSGLIVARTDPNAVHLVVVVIGTQANPSMDKLTQLMHIALSAS